MLCPSTQLISWTSSRAASVNAGHHQSQIAKCGCYLFQHNHQVAAGVEDHMIGSSADASLRDRVASDVAWVEQTAPASQAVFEHTSPEPGVWCLNSCS